MPAKIALSITKFPCPRIQPRSGGTEFSPGRKPWVRPEKEKSPGGATPQNKSAAIAGGCIMLGADGLLIRIQQHAFVFLGVHWPIEQLVVLQEDFDKRGPRLNRALDERLGQRVLDVLLQGPA